MSEHITSEDHVQTITKLIDEGSTKFKYGLLWYLMYSAFECSDYHYIDFLKLSENEIHDILKPHVEFANYVKSNDFQYHYYYIKDLKKFVGDKCLFITVDSLKTKSSFNEEEKQDKILIMSRLKFDEVDYLSDIMYYLLTHDTFHRMKFMDTIYHAANRVIRNYSSAGLIKIDKSCCMTYIQCYRKEKRLKGECNW